jgi:hypothetical protein
MKRLSQSTVLILVASVFLGLGNSLASTFAAEPINLLLVGDSITSQAKYLAPLQTQLTDSGRKSTLIGKCCYPGWFIDNVRSNIADSLAKPNVNTDTTYILLMIGINDMGGSDTAPGATDRLKALISKITTSAPRAHLIVAQITPHWDPEANARVREYNQAIAPLVKEFQTAGAKISTVDMYTPFQPNPVIYMQGEKNAHPSQAGGDLMAKVWYRGITAAAAPPSDKPATKK